MPQHQTDHSNTSGTNWEKIDHEEFTTSEDITNIDLTKDLALLHYLNHRLNLNFNIAEPTIPPTSTTTIDNPKHCSQDTQLTATDTNPPATIIFPQPPYPPSLQRPVARISVTDVFREWYHFWHTKAHDPRSPKERAEINNALIVISAAVVFWIAILSWLG
ncbi:uncharacterized protein CLAFUR5_04890 [Fulvia fulva]|uniref:Uncharacterized protein n=1 Tax=Passalora fulva TaxID=5499 RepID=A0A9Q8LG11_PASFU|nr:uncharacterized protein CLAFUR5_04890 [Fulvia fulva]UJO16777.1 hypothetical protein CLAFUR5_04890 [Fulvia fulva]